jgi:hypothetical protein
MPIIRTVFNTSWIGGIKFFGAIARDTIGFLIPSYAFLTRWMALFASSSIIIEKSIRTGIYTLIGQMKFKIRNACNALWTCLTRAFIAIGTTLITNIRIGGIIGIKIGRTLINTSIWIPVFIYWIAFSATAWCESIAFIAGCFTLCTDGCIQEIAPVRRTFTETSWIVWVIFLWIVASETLSDGRPITSFARAITLCAN